MSHLIPHKLHVDFREGITQDEPLLPRTYTLTHSDSTGDLFLTVAQEYNFPQISGWYTRFMRDEVLAEWHFDEQPSLHVHCHVRHMPMVLESFRYGDRKFIAAHPELDEALIWVHFHARQERHNQVEAWGRMANYNILQDLDLGTIA